MTQTLSSSMGTLYVVATPIGNLEDVSSRAIRVLQEVELVLCEDTRVTRRLLERYAIKAKTASLHQHTDERTLDRFVDLLRQGQHLALVTDAGTTGISDPGGKFIDVCWKSLSDFQVIPVPGPCAAVTALSVSGFPADSFTFLGFPPHKKGRESFFRELAKREDTVVFYESTHRIEKTMQSLSDCIPERLILLARELTKVHETLYRGKPAEVTAVLKAGSLRGEFVIVIAPKNYV